MSNQGLIAGRSVNNLNQNAIFKSPVVISGFLQAAYVDFFVDPAIATEIQSGTPLVWSDTDMVVEDGIIKGVYVEPMKATFNENTSEWTLNGQLATISTSYCGVGGTNGFVGSVRGITMATVVGELLELGSVSTTDAAFTVPALMKSCPNMVAAPLACQQGSGQMLINILGISTIEV